MKIYTFVLTVAMLLIFPGVAHAEGTVLTEDIVKKFIEVYPEYDKITKEIAKLNEKPDSEEKREQVKTAMDKRTALVKGKGWEDDADFINLTPRMVPVMTSFTLREKMKKMPGQGRKAMEDAIKDLQKDYTPEEIAVMTKYEKELRKTGFIPKS